MEVSKFIIDDNDIYVKDAEARSELEVQSESMSEIQSEVDSQSVAYSEMFSEVDVDITSGLSTKQNLLTKLSNFSGDIDTLYADSSVTSQNNGVYFCDATVVTGTLPFTTGYFTLVVLRNIQIAFPYKTPASDTSDATVKFRDHTNGWRLWRGALFTV